jgi:osmotically-inducible protein OsmY
VRVPLGPGWALVGDAGFHQDPWSGRGIDQAMLQASYLAEALGACFGGATNEREALQAYHQRRDADALPGYRRTVSLSRDLTQRSLEGLPSSPTKGGSHQAAPCAMLKAQKESKMARNAGLERAVLDELASDADINATAIQVLADDDTVTLQGSIASYAERDAALRDVARVPGVRTVVDEIELRLPPEAQLTDADIVGAARDALRWSSQVPDERVTVSAHWGRVTLGGEVPYESQRQAAADAVSSLTGVSGVDNEIRIEPSVSADDVKQRVEEALARNASTDGNIQVDAVDGTITLSGTVHSLAERDEAEWAAWAVHGVNDVLNDLVIAG